MADRGAAKPGRSVNLLIHDSAGRLFVQFRDGQAPKMPLCWGFWGGRVDPQDKGDPVRAAIREMREELGVETGAADWRSIHSRSGSDGQSSTLMSLRQPVAWADVSIREGAGGAFLTPAELTQLTLHKRLRYYLEEHPALLAADRDTPIS
jgi:8-oxo-dGTP pyrophosphatase MutT (NUDIX family)